MNGLPFTPEQVKRRLLLLKRKRKIIRARDDLVHFSQYNMPSPDSDDADVSDYVAAKHHRVLCAAMEQVESGAIRRLVITIPPRSGKTLTVSHMFPAWYMGRHPQHSFMLGTYSEKFAADHGRAVRDIMQSPLYSHVFPNVKLRDDAAAQDRLELENGGVMFFLGRKAGTTGRGAHMIVIDDPLKDSMEASSPTIRERVWEWYSRVLKTRLMSDVGCIVLIATRWNEDDLTGRIIDPTNPHFSAQEAKLWRKIDLPALANENDVLGRQPGEALWPERFSANYLRGLQKADHRGFEALYQGNPTPSEGNFFDKRFIQTYKRMSDMPHKDELRFYCASDHAVSLKQEGDKSVLVPVGVDKHGTIWIQPDVWWNRAPTDMAVEAMLRMMQKYHPLLWWAERDKITKAIGPFLRKRMIETQTFCSIDEVTPILDKMQRAQSIHARMSMGCVRWPEFAPWWPQAYDQLLKFPLAAHDDLVDAIALVGLKLDQLAVRRPKKVEPAAPEIGSIDWLKGETKRQQREKRQAGSQGW